jgi:hypothetical protein
MHFIQLMWALVLLLFAFNTLAYDPLENFSLTIAIISNNRLASLKRLMASLLRVENPNNRKIKIVFNLEASSEQPLVDFVYHFHWPFGDKSIKKRIKQGGLISAVTESWYPSSDRDYGILLEDDIEVSQYFLIWIEKNLDQIYAENVNWPNTRIIGISLYTPRVTETQMRRPLNSSHITSVLSGHPHAPFMFQTPCSWGALYFPNPWREFLDYMQHRIEYISYQYPVMIPGSRTNGWSASWKKYLFELMWIKGYFLVYPNFPGEHSFSTNHLEVGEHITIAEDGRLSHSKQLFTVPLLESASYLDNLETHPFRELPYLDLFGEPFLNETSLYRSLRNLIDNSDIAYNIKYDDKGLLPELEMDLYKPINMTNFVKPKSAYTIKKITNIENVSPKALVKKEKDSFSSKEMLYIGSLLYSDKRNVIASTGRGEGSDMFIGFTTQDGAFVIIKTVKSRKVRITSDHIRNSFFSTQNNDPSMSGPYSFGLYDDGVLRVTSLGHDRVNTIWSSSNPSAKSDKYVARLESNGNLIVYKDIESVYECTGIVWASLSTSRLPERCLIAAKSKQENQRVSISRQKTLCLTFPNVTGNYFRDRERITIVISTMSRFETLYKQIVYYSKSPLVSMILVTWHNQKLRPPRSALINNAIVHFVPQQYDSLNNRFNPNIQIVTEAVFIMDDDMKINIEDLSVLFQVWLKFPDNIVGTSPRWFHVNDRLKVTNGSELIPGNSNKKQYLTYISASNDPVKNSNDPPRPGYGLMLTKSMMLHKRYLFEYSCGKFDSDYAFHDLVDKKKNCEDITMNAVVAFVTHKIIDSPPLFVEPIHDIGDFGSHGDKSALHLKTGEQNWNGIRSQCLNKANYRFYATYKTSIPLQKKVIEVNKDSQELIRIAVVDYHGYQRKIIHDCPVGDFNETCLWEYPEKPFNPKYEWV